MDRKYFWKRTEDIEIDLTELFRRLCRKWKQIMVCALVSAVVLGGYGWMQSSKDADTAVPDVIEEAALTEEEEQGVAAAVQLKNEITSLQEYLDNSVLMQIDPYHKNRFVMLYCIENAKQQELSKITESYLNYIVNGGAVDALAKSGSSVWKMDRSYLAELVTAYQKIYSSPYQMVIEDAADSSILSESLFYIEITGKDAGTAEQMARDIQDVLKGYSAEVMNTSGSHKLTLVSTAKSITADSGLLTQQRDKKMLLSSNRTSLKTMTDAFSKNQMTVYKGEADIAEDGKDIGENENVSNINFSIKYVLIGFVGGIFVYCAVFSCLYLFDDTVKNTEEIRRMYLFPFFGSIALKGKIRKQGGRMSERQQDVYECSKAQLLNRIRLACKKQGVAHLCAVSDFLYDGQERECLESIAEQLKGWGIEMAVAENACLDTAVWDKLSEDGNVLIACRIHTTTHRMIDDAMEFYRENGIHVLGAAAFITE